VNDRHRCLATHRNVRRDTANRASCVPADTRAKGVGVMMASDQTNTRRRPATTVGTKKILAMAALATELRDGVMRFNRRLRQARPVGDLTGSQLSVLSSLELAGALTPRELAESERVQPPTMTRVVARLESMGVVQRTAHPTDGRQV